jgi:hypothetical protein
MKISRSAKCPSIVEPGNNLVNTMSKTESLNSTKINLIKQYTRLGHRQTRQGRWIFHKQQEVFPVVGPSGGTLLYSKSMCKRVHVGGEYIDIRKII